MATKQIPCRVCGKLFEPCAYCKAHEDVFRWRNFACSRECAAKYIEDATAYRKSLRNIKDKKTESSIIEKTDKTTATRKKSSKKVSEDIIIENRTKEKETD